MRKFRARDSEKIFFSFFLSFEQREIDLSERMANITRFKTTWVEGSRDGIFCQISGNE